MLREFKVFSCQVQGSIAAAPVMGLILHFHGYSHTIKLYLIIPQDFKVALLSVTKASIKVAFGSILVGLLLIPAYAAAANGSLGGSAGDGFFGSSDEPKFLPVEQAYALTPSIKDDRILLRWDIAPGYYLYQHKFRFTAHTAEGTREFTPNFPPGKPIFDEYYNKELTVYYGQTQVSLSFEASAPFELWVQSQGCADAGLCYPPRTQYVQVNPQAQTILTVPSSTVPSNTLPLSKVPSSQAPTSQIKTTATPAPTEASEQTSFLPWILLAALGGGIILNLMPCVFPVLSLKALSFASSHLSRHKQHVHGWAYTAGVVGSFLLAAAVMLAARGAGETVGWGFQLQSPIFVALMTYLFFAMSLSLAGLFNFGTRMMGVGQSLTRGHGLRASFFTGVLAALVASPCTAPLMATALGFAMTQPAHLALLVFAALGLGMALPFLLLSYSPRLAQRLPQPGPWMETLKQLLAFPLLLTCVWLLWVLGHQISSDAVAAILVGGTAIAFGCWLWQKKPASRPLQVTVRLIAIAAMAFALSLATQVKHFAEPEDSHWQPYSADTLAQLRASDTPVFINLTADWCITCLVNERIALDTTAVKTAAQELGVAMLKGDWTNADPAITALLQKFGRSGVPLYLIYPANGTEAEILPQVLTPQIVIQAMRRATNIE